ncbi:MAG: M16 family metallopeptidase, partial [Acidobacteriota bacterium]
MKGLALGALVLVACATTSGGGLEAPPAPPRRTNLEIAITQMSMTNGLRVVLVRDPRAPEVAVTMRYRVGFVDDPPGQEGMAHLVEHLMFQQVVGATTIFSRVVDDTTAFDGRTDLDATTYMERAPRERLDEMLMIEAVRVGMRCTSISDSVFARERQVVIDEAHWRGASDRLTSAIVAGVYPEGHPYRRTPETEQTLGSITRQQACAFADAHYTPGNAVMVISGNL